MTTTRRTLLTGAGAALLLPRLGHQAKAATPLLNVSTRTLDVRGRAATVFGIAGSNGKLGIFAQEGDRFAGAVHNATGEPLIMHWHGQVHAAADQDRSRPDGGALAAGAHDTHDFKLTAGSHWMHSHQLTEQQLLAAPMITREKDAGDVQDVVLMLHDFAFRSPAEILAELGGTNGHGAHGATGAQSNRSPASTMPGMNHGSMPMGGMMPGMSMGGMAGMRVHANDVAYDAYLANDRTLDDPGLPRIRLDFRVNWECSTLRRYREQEIDPLPLRERKLSPLERLAG